MAKSNRAARLHAIATELGCDPELVGVVGKGLRSDDAIRQAVLLHLSNTGAPATEPVDEPVSEDPQDDAPTGDEQETPEADEAPAPKPRKAGLTLSQRRALLRLQDADGEPVVAASAFRALPLDYLVSVGLAEGDLASGFTLTDEGVDRAASINPGYRVWASGETVADDPTRPWAGTKRSGLGVADLRDVAPVAELPAS